MIAQGVGVSVQGARPEVALNRLRKQEELLAVLPVKLILERHLDWFKVRPVHQ